MSPEQARGRKLDKRSDIFSFGVVLYEMLSGKKAFGGEDVSDILASVIKLEPGWAALPDALDPRIERLPRRCVEKDRKKRRRDIGDVRDEIVEAIVTPYIRPTPAEERGGSRRLAFLPASPVFWPVLQPPRSCCRLPRNTPSRAFPSQRRA